MTMESALKGKRDLRAWMGRSLLLATVLTVVTTIGCSRQDDTTPAAGPERYCALAQKLDQQAGPPTKKQMTEIEQAAPDEIRADVHALLIDHDPAAEPRLVAWEKTHCS